jgi:16S rRNA (uracil1498-N3)-methyltransferase
MEYYYTTTENISGDSLVITGEEAIHLNKVLRKNPGEEIFVTDGRKNLYKTIIEKISKAEIVCRIIEKYYDVNEPKLNIHLYQSLLKNPARFEFAIEKSVELGVNEITPLITENTINKKRDKVSRWQSIALSAMKQSQRCYLPIVNQPMKFADAIKSRNSEIKIVAHEKETEDYLTFENLRNINETLRPSQGAQADLTSISIFIGPEGGFTDDEINTAASSGAKFLNLGKRKYRSETAAVVVMCTLTGI